MGYIAKGAMSSERTQEYLSLWRLRHTTATNTWKGVQEPSSRKSGAYYGSAFVDLYISKDGESTDIVTRRAPCVAVYKFESSVRQTDVRSV